ncbi:MAG: hypothetical protein ACREWG_11815 [Gammaproteobacteria bacterium]
MAIATKFVNQFVLLGASNLTRALATAVDAARQVCGGPSRVLVAAGHGRSYGVYSRVLFRGLPGIRQCGLWDDLRKGPRLPTFALITDLGNDIVYGIAPEEILGWVRCCVECLAEHHARILVTRVPLQRLEQLTPSGYRLVRALLFPGRQLSLPEALDRARAIDLALGRLAPDYGLRLVEQRPEWYGLDPVHIRRRMLATAYGEIFKHWLDTVCDEPPVVKPGLGRWLRFQLLAPQYQCVCGFNRHRRQPAGMLTDGSTLSLY